MKIIAQKIIPMTYDKMFKSVLTTKEAKGYLISLISNITGIEKEKYYNTISEYMISICAPKVWKYKEEHSNQIEIISDVLKDEEISWKKLKDVLLFYIDNGAYISGKSAAHIHIGKQVLKGNLNYWLNFFKLLSVFEKQIVKFSNGESYYERESFNNYSKWSSDILKKLFII